MLSRRIRDGLLSAIRAELKKQAVKVFKEGAESKNKMVAEKTDSKSHVVGAESKIAEVVNKFQSMKVVAESTNKMVAVKSVSKPPAVAAESMMAVITVQAVVGELRRGKRIKIGKKMFGE